MAINSIFVDTNIFLHFKSFDQVPWNSIINKTEFEIVLAPIVTTELDEKKYDKNEKVQKKARNSLPKIFKHYEKNLEPKLVILEKMPREPDFKRFNLNMQSNDDRLLCSLLKFKEDNPGNNIIYVSYDYGPLFKAKNLGIDTIKMPEEYLDNRKSDLENKVAKLEKENMKLNNAIPKLKIQFANGKSFIDIKLPKVEFIEDIKDRIANEKERYPHEKIEKDYGLTGLMKLNKVMTGFTNGNIDTYNRDLDEYFIDYENSLNKHNKYLEFKASSFEFNIEIVNEGTKPVEEVDVFIYFPDGFELISENERMKEPFMPNPPRIRSLADLIGNSTVIPQIYRPPTYNPEATEITETNSYELTKTIAKIKHNQKRLLGPLTIVYENISKVKSFNVEYIVHASNIPNEIKGMLSFRNKSN